MLGRRLAVEQNHPNPFASKTTVRFALPADAPVHVAVYDALGMRVTILMEEPLPAGWHATTWDAGNRAGGVYLCVIRAGGAVATEKFVLLK